MLNDVLYVVIATLAGLYAAAFCHELGHAVMGRLAGYQVTSFGLGVARPFWVGNWRGTRIYLCRTKPLQGIAFSFHPDLHPARWKQALMLSGGIMAHCSLFVIAMCLWKWLPVGEGVWFLIAGVNGLLALVNLVPLRVKIGQSYLRSDGAQLLLILLGREPPSRFTDLIRMTRAFEGLWQSIGDVTCHYIFLLHEAASWLSIGDPGEAERKCAQAEALPIVHTPFTRALSALIRGCIASAQRSPEANQILAESEGAFQKLGIQGGVFAAAITRVEQLAKRGERSPAEQLLDELGQQALALNRPSVTTAYLVAWVGVACSLEDAESLYKAVQAYQDLPPGHRSEAPDLQVQRVLASWHAKREECAQAAAAYRKALAAAIAIHLALPTQEDQERYRTCQAALIQEARECLLRLELHEEAQALELIFQRPVQLNDTRRLQREKKLRRIGVLLTIANALLLVVDIELFSAMRQKVFALPTAPTMLLALLGFLLALFVIIAAAHWLIRWAVGLLRPSQKNSGGAWTLALAVIPWMIWLVLAVLVVLVPPDRH